jgi:hypothetical protein
MLIALSVMVLCLLNPMMIEAKHHIGTLTGADMTLRRINNYSYRTKLQTQAVRRAQ